MSSHNPPADPFRPRLSRPQIARLDLASEDLTRAREANLASMEPAALVRLVERLRSALDDTTRLVDELAQEADDATTSNDSNA